MAAAKIVFAEAGFGGTTKQLIADSAGLPKANLYHCFATNDDLYGRVVQDIFEIWFKAAETMDSAPGPVEEIGAYIEAKIKVTLPGSVAQIL